MAILTIDSRSIFSIDVDSHIRKVAGHTYCSPFHYPVELVRTALQRKASRVDIKLNKDYIEIIDNGLGIQERAVNSLANLLDPNIADEKREESISYFCQPQGIGLLAILSPSPELVEVENITDSKQTSIMITNSTLTVQPGCLIPSGTRIKIISKIRNLDEESQYLRNYCMYAEPGIFLNNELISQKPAVGHAMISISTGSLAPGIKKGKVGIMADTELCHLCQTDHGIIWSRSSLPPISGMVFSAVIESSVKISRAIKIELALTSARLYQVLCRRYPKYPARYRNKVDELIFNHYRLTRDNMFLKIFRPFRLLNSNELLSVFHLKALADKGPLYAVYSESKNIRSIQSNTGLILILTRVQLDFLLHQVKIPLNIIPDLPGIKDPILDRLRSRVFSLMVRIKNSLSRDTLISASALEQKEIELLTLLAKFINENKELLQLPAFTEVRMKKGGSGPIEKLFARNPIKIKSRFLILVKREHPLTKNLIRSVQSKQKNIEIILPLLSNGLNL